MESDEIKLKIIIAPEEENEDRRWELHQALKSELRTEVDVIEVEDKSKESHEGKGAKDIIVGILKIIFGSDKRNSISEIITSVIRARRSDVDLEWEVTNPDGTVSKKKLRVNNAKLQDGLNLPQILKM